MVDQFAQRSSAGTFQLILSSGRFEYSGFNGDVLLSSGWCCDTAQLPALLLPDPCACSHPYPMMASTSRTLLSSREISLRLRLMRKLRHKASQALWEFRAVLPWLPGVTTLRTDSRLNFSVLFAPPRVCVCVGGGGQTDRQTRVQG